MHRCMDAWMGACTQVYMDAYMFGVEQELRLGRDLVIGCSAWLYLTGAQVLGIDDWLQFLAAGDWALHLIVRFSVWLQETGRYI